MKQANYIRPSHYSPRKHISQNVSQPVASYFPHKHHLWCYVCLRISPAVKLRFPPFFSPSNSGPCGARRCSADGIVATELLQGRFSQSGVARMLVTWSLGPEGDILFSLFFSKGVTGNKPHKRPLAIPVGISTALVYFLYRFFPSYGCPHLVLCDTE